MKFLVAETIYYSVEAENADAAIANRKRGDGTPKLEHTSYRASNWNVSENETIPIYKWPGWANEFKAISIAEDKGIGDVVMRVVGPENSEPFRTWMQQTFNKSCTGGCVARLNALYPLERNP